MRGEVISVDGLSGDGLITGEDGVRYGFSAAGVRAALQPGDRVDFVVVGNAATEIMLLASSARPSAPPAFSPAAPAHHASYDFGWAMFSFDGRLRQSHFWISWLILFFSGIVLGMIPILGAIIQLLMIWPHLAIGAKRFHDMGKTGWLISIPWGIMTVGMVAMVVSIGFSAISNPAAFESDDPLTMFSAIGPSFAIVGVSWLIAIGFWLWLGIADSQPGRNKYGRNPKNPHDDAEIFA